MPLCTLEIPREGISLDAAKNIGDLALTVTLDGLRIPKPDDKEMRIIRSDLRRDPTLSIGFTIGEHEYPNLAPAPEAFFPPHILIEQVRAVILHAPEVSGHNIRIVRMEPWRNTTFIQREGKPVEFPYPLLSVKETQNLSIRYPELKLIVSPEKSRHISVPKESMPSQEANPYQKVADELYHQAEKLLGLPENTKGRVTIITPEYADTDISLEWDCSSDSLIPERVRETLATVLLNMLDTNPLTREGSAKVWVRQGVPEI